MIAIRFDSQSVIALRCQSRGALSTYASRSSSAPFQAQPFAAFASALRGARLPFSPGGRMLSAAGTMESSMNKAGLDNRHRNKDGEISHKHGNTLIRTLRKIYGQGFAAGYPETEKLSEVLVQLNETSLSQLRRDHETGHLEHKIANASK